MNNDMTKYISNDRFAAYTGIRLTKIDIGYAEAELELEEKHLNGVNIVQGGVYFTLADFAFAAASNSTGLVTVSINASISYFKPPKGKKLKAKATQVSSSRKLCNYVVDIFDEDDTLLAKYNGTGYIKG
jgi:acyl-CoA thioesterase